MSTTKALTAIKRASFYNEKAAHFYTLAQKALEATPTNKTKTTATSKKRGRPRSKLD